MLSDYFYKAMMNYSMKNEKENFYFVNVKLQQCINVEEYSAEHEIKITLIQSTREIKILMWII